MLKQLILQVQRNGLNGAVQTFQLRASLAPKHICGGKTLITSLKYNWHTICEDQHTAFGERLNNRLNEFVAYIWFACSSKLLLCIWYHGKSGDEKENKLL